MANLNINVAANTASANKGIDNLRSNLKGVSGVAKGVTSAIAGMMAPLIGIVAVLGGISVASRGIKDAIDFGGEIDDMSSKTGIAAKDLVILKEAFKLAGMEGADLGKIVNGLSAKLDAPTPKILETMESLGLSMSEVQKLPIGERFQVVGNAISNLSSATARAAASQTLFGKAAGNNLLVLFNNKGAMEEAKKAVGGLGDSMEEHAANLAGIGDALDTVDTKMRQFFVALLGQNVDRLKSVADLLMGIDLTKAGEAAGAFIAKFANIGQILVDAFNNGNLWDTITTGVSLAFKETEPYLVGFFKYLGNVLAESFKNAAVQTIPDVLGKTTRSLVLGVDSMLTGEKYAPVERKDNTLKSFIDAEEGRRSITPKEQALKDQIAKQPVKEEKKTDYRDFQEPVPGSSGMSPFIARSLEATMQYLSDFMKQKVGNPKEEYDSAMKSLGNLRAGNNKDFLTSKQRVGGASIFAGNAGLNEQRETNNILRRMEEFWKRNPPNKGGTTNTAATFG